MPLQNHYIHEEDVQIMEAVRATVLGREMLDRGDQVVNPLLVGSNLEVIALCPRQEHPAILLKLGLVPLLDSMEGDGVHRDFTVAMATRGLTSLSAVPHYN